MSAKRACCRFITETTKVPAVSSLTRTMRACRLFDRSTEVLAREFYESSNEDFASSPTNLCARRITLRQPCAGRTKRLGERSIADAGSVDAEIVDGNVLPLQINPDQCKKLMVVRYFETKKQGSALPQTKI